jgi:acyl dehydratase
LFLPRLSPLPAHPPSPLPPPPVSQTLTTTRTFTPADVASFLALSGDANPLHTAAGGSASSPPAPPPLLPGLLTASLFPGLVGTAAPGALYARQTLAFVAPAAVGGAVRAEVEVIRVCRPPPGGRFAARADFRTRAWVEGGGLVVEGEATALLPKREG